MPESHELHEAVVEELIATRSPPVGFVFDLVSLTWGVAFLSAASLGFISSKNKALGCFCVLLLVLVVVVVLVWGVDIWTFSLFLSGTAYWCGGLELTTLTLFMTALPFLAMGFTILGVLPVVPSAGSCFSFNTLLLLLVCDMVFESCVAELVVLLIDAFVVVQLANVINWLYFFMFDLILACLPCIFMNNSRK